MRLAEKFTREIALEDLPGLAGEELGVSEWVTITQERVNAFADATGDHQWIHVDVERARAEIGGPIAHGFLTLSLIPMLSQSLMSITGVKRCVVLGCNSIRFRAMVRVGDRIRLRQKLITCDRRAGIHTFISECRIEVEGERRAACIAETVAMLYAD
jgi:acyl dehydratase